MALKRIAVLTSGGDAPGMNAAIRAATRTAIASGAEMFGVRHGYAGLITNDIHPLELRGVGGIIQQGGTVLGSARSHEFRTEEGRQIAIANLQALGIEGLIVIGGNGSQTGAYVLNEMGFPVVGVASTIDNDLLGCDVTIGANTAVNVALEAIDRLKVTASSHRRAFLIEVMGRDCGYLAVMAAIAGGAEAVVVPEVETTPEALANKLHDSYSRGKTNGIIVVAEGAKYPTEELLAYFKANRDDLGFELRATILGHVQRGGAPDAFDRVLASRTASAAAELLIGGTQGVLVGIINNEIVTTPHKDIAGKTKPLDLDLLRLEEMLAQ